MPLHYYLIQDILNVRLKNEVNAMKNVNINISIPAGVLLSLKENERVFSSEIKKLSAVKLYEQERLSVGQSAELADMSVEDFIELLGVNKVSIFRFDNISELEDDVNNA